MLPTSLLYCLVRDLMAGPKELYAKGGIYAHMVDLQAQGQSWTI